MLLSIESKYFYCGIILDDNGICLKAAPIVHYMIGWNLKKIYNYCKKKFFIIRLIDKN